MVYINTGKHYEHYNRAMGKKIRSKKHYQEEMKKGGYCTLEEGRQRVAEKEARVHKPYKASKKARSIIDSAHRDSKGNVHLPDRAVDELKRMGVSFDKKKVEKHIKEAKEQGGQ